MSKKSDKKAAAKAGHTLICQNRRALHNFAIDERLEAGVVLVGTEVKALRAGKAHLNDAYVQIIKGEAMLIGGNIAEYSHGNQFNHAPVRTRKLLLHRRQIDKIYSRVHEKGYTAVALSMYFNAAGRVKVEIGVGRGKTDVDRRVDIKAREARREIDRVMRRNSR
ncbi:MAG TPA: SsrA-binding protein SmpB [Myxococcota bacterium]|nr:SsrA-binding protein SmpB [Myxococcota bacterium]